MTTSFRGGWSVGLLRRGEGVDHRLTELRLADPEVVLRHEYQPAVRLRPQVPQQRLGVAHLPGSLIPLRLSWESAECGKVERRTEEDGIARGQVDVVPAADQQGILESSCIGVLLVG